MILRDYQQKAIDALYAYLQARDDNPVIVAPTGSGKSLIIAAICRDVVVEGGRALVLTHVKELIQQNSEKIRVLCPELHVGVYSAGLNKRNTDSQIIVAGIQSVRNRACEIGSVDIIIIDEAHRINPDEGTSYQKFIADAKVVNPNVRIVGLTATPYRLDCGALCHPDHILNAVAYEIGINELIEQGYLCKVFSRVAENESDTSEMKLVGGEFSADSIDRVMNTEPAVISAVDEIIQKTGDRKCVLIFAATVAHGDSIVRILKKDHGIECGFIIGETPTIDRAETLQRFQDGDLRYLCNVGVLTTGYDCPKIDMVAILRPTMSPGLFVQMVGRGFRVHPDKKDCLVLDFGQNFLRHGPIDKIRPKKKTQSDMSGEAPFKICDTCQNKVHTGFSVCPHCSSPFPEKEIKHDAKPSDAPALSNQQKITFTDCEVIDTRYSEHRKKGADESHPRTLRVEYKTGKLGMWRSEWVCFEHEGFARQKAVKWWSQRSPDPCPRTVKRALEIIDSGGIAITTGIRLKEKENDKFPEIVSYTVGPMPEPVPAEDYETVLALANERREDALPAGLSYGSAPPEMATSYKDEEIPW